MNEYELKQERRRQRLEARAERLRAEGGRRIDRAREMASVIPFGQPILIGHHSEKRDRNYREKIHNNFAAGFETLKAAEEVERRADSVGTGGISSDDPDSVVKLKEKLAKLEANQEHMVAANKALRKDDRDALHALGFSDATIAQLKESDYCGRTGFPSYALTNNGANIRRIKERILSLERAATRETTETVRTDGVRIVENAEANRLQLFFPGKPSAEIRTSLKQAGFRWSPSEGAWQRHLNNSARYAVEYALGKCDLAAGK